MNIKFLNSLYLPFLGCIYYYSRRYWWKCQWVFF